MNHFFLYFNDHDYPSALVVYDNNNNYSLYGNLHFVNEDTPAIINHTNIHETEDYLYLVGSPHIDTRENHITRNIIAIPKPIIQHRTYPTGGKFYAPPSKYIFDIAAPNNYNPPPNKIVHNVLLDIEEITKESEREKKQFYYPQSTSICGLFVKEFDSIFSSIENTNSPDFLEKVRTNFKDEQEEAIFFLNLNLFLYYKASLVKDDAIPLKSTGQIQPGSIIFDGDLIILITEVDGNEFFGNIYKPKFGFVSVDDEDTINLDSNPIYHITKEVEEVIETIKNQEATIYNPPERKQESIKLQKEDENKESPNIISENEEDATTSDCTENENINTSETKTTPPKEIPMTNTNSTLAALKTNLFEGGKVGTAGNLSAGLCKIIREKSGDHYPDILTTELGKVIEPLLVAGAMHFVATTYPQIPQAANVQAISEKVMAYAGVQSIDKLAEFIAPLFAAITGLTSTMDESKTSTNN